MEFAGVTAGDVTSDSTDHRVLIAKPAAIADTFSLALHGKLHASDSAEYERRVLAFFAQFLRAPP